MEQTASITAMMGEWIRSLFTYDPSSPLMIGSMPFAVLFIIFLSIFVVLRSKSRTAMMLYVIAFSLFFAYKTNGWVAMLLPATAIVNYRLTEVMRSASTRKKQKMWLTLVVVIDLLLLGYFKYYLFVVNDIVNVLFSTNFSPSAVALPVGISFYTFQAISYAVDVYRGRFTMHPTRLEYYFYLTFFPLLMAGPITRAKNLLPRLRRNHQASSRMVWTGLMLIMLGLIKKNLFSDYIAQFNGWVFDEPTAFSGFENMMAMMGYPIQLYLDFSGYSDMSIGVAAMMGFWLPDNFWFPYRSLNLTDFWRRWHISLSTWFRDYVYIPLGGNRCSTARTYLNNFLTMMVAGLWHGASWMFIIWGALHGVGLCIHKFFARQLKITIPRTWWGNALSWLLTYVFVSLAFTLFRAPDLSALGTMWYQVFSDFDWAYLSPFWSVRRAWCIMVLLVCLSYLLPERAYQRMQLYFIKLPWIAKLLLFIVCLQLVIEFSQQSVQPFLYFQF